MPELPEGFMAQMRSLIGDEAEALFNALNAPRPLSVRLNLRKLTNPGAAYTDMTPVGWCDSGYYLNSDQRPSFTLNPLLHAGAFYVQEASSMIYQQAMTKILQREQWDAPRVLDMCAAPGGKTTSMINALPDDAAVIANEYVGKRAVILRENLQKWGFPIVAVSNSDSSAFANHPELFDIIAVDAPCSGEGMMRREPEARRQWSPVLVEQCASLQREILQNAVSALRPGGWLIYSTCTFNAEENERNSEFIASLPGMKHELLSLEGVPEESYATSAALSSIAPGIRFMPHITRGEGLFINFFRKEGNSGGSAYSGNMDKGKKEKKKGKSQSDEAALLKEAEQWLRPEIQSYYLLQNINGTIVATNRNLKTLTDILARDLRYISIGVDMAEAKGKNLIPLTPFLLSGLARENLFPKANLPLDDALQYLRGEAITLDKNVPKGLVEISFEGHPLGYAKNLGNRANNLYPAPWRIKNL